jgi:dTDP-4-dehydrorhamnose 3,5-epimerase
MMPACRTLMKFHPAAIPDVVIIERELHRDERGFFMETFRAAEFAQHGIAGPFVHDNHTGSRRGTLRGLHYQIRQPQGKLVGVVAGEVFDVSVDLRRRSSSFGQWVGVSLTMEGRQLLWVPPGFAHGFYVLSEWAEVTYKATDYYAPEWERSLLWNDPDLAITWPLIEAARPLLSDKDADGTPFRHADTFD